MSTTTIQTNLKGDASGLVAAAQAAGNAMTSLGERKIASAARAKEAYMSELAAIKLQAGGYDQMAQHIRNVADAREQAYKLAARANIPIGEATKLVTAQAAAVALVTQNLERQAVEQARVAQAAAQAAQAAATAASQQSAAFAALSQQQASRRASAQAADAAMEIAAAKAASARAAAIANPRATGVPGGGILPPLTPSYLAAMDRHTAQTRELSRQQGQLSGSTKNSALGFLAFSQALEDSQYGIKGVLNNIPQMIMGFGMGAGIAGAISIAAVAATVLYPALKRLTGAMDSERAVAYAENLLKLSIAGKKAAEKDFNSVAMAREAVDYGAQLTEQYRQRIALGSDMAKVWLDEIDASKRTIAFEKELADIKTRTKKAEGKDVSDAPKVAHEKELADIENEKTKRKKVMMQLQADLATQGERQANIEKENAQKILDLETQRLSLLKSVERTKAQIAATTDAQTRTKAEKPGPIDDMLGAVVGTAKGTAHAISELFSGRQDSQKNLKVAGDEMLKQGRAWSAEMKQHKNLLKQTGETLSKNETLLESFTGKQTEANKAGADAVTTLKAQIAALNTKLQLEDNEIKALATKTEELKEAKKATDKLRDAESAAEARARDPRQGGWFGGETPEEAAEAAAKEAAGKQSRQDVVTELDMLKLQQQGRSKIAEELGKEVELRKEAKALAEKTNRSEEEMLATLREINAQKKDIADAGRSPAERRADRAKERTEGKARRIRDARVKNRLDRPQIPRTNEEKKRAKEREEGKAVRDEQDRRNKAADLGKADEEAKKGWGKLISTQDKLAAFLEELSKI
jgi:hypothetical protein